MLKNKKRYIFARSAVKILEMDGAVPWMQVLEFFCGRACIHREKAIRRQCKVTLQRQQSEPVILKEISLSEDERQTTEIGELDRCSGGGIVPGSLFLVGEIRVSENLPFFYRCAGIWQRMEVSVLYISGEESLRQIKLRANRIGTFNDNLQLLCETNLDTVREVMERKKPDVAIVDSIQTMFHEEIGSAPGSVSQVRESTNVLMQIAKGLGITIFHCWSCDQGGQCGRSGECWNIWLTQCFILKETDMLLIGFCVR